MFGFGCSAGTFGTNMRVYRRNGHYNLLYGSEVGIVQGEYAQYALAPFSLMTLTLSFFPWRKVSTIPIAG